MKSLPYDIFGQRRHSNCTHYPAALIVRCVGGCTPGNYGGVSAADIKTIPVDFIYNSHTKLKLADALFFFIVMLPGIRYLKCKPPTAKFWSQPLDAGIMFLARTPEWSEPQAESKKALD